MGKVELEIPEDLKFIEKASHVDWSILFNKILRAKLDRISRVRRIIKKSKLSEKDVEELSDKINESLSKRYLK
ncbi:hypothetical protein HYV49_06045 [Candidatus Pacearchaeota archaeon]|nr:hypothetical protein [Candidatus Pacearchaeota archaeon]